MYMHQYIDSILLIRFQSAIPKLAVACASIHHIIHILTTLTLTLTLTLSLTLSINLTLTLILVGIVNLQKSGTVPLNKGNVLYLEYQVARIHVFACPIVL